MMKIADRMIFFDMMLLICNRYAVSFELIYLIMTVLSNSSLAICSYDIVLIFSAKVIIISVKTFLRIQINSIFANQFFSYVYYKRIFGKRDYINFYKQKARQEAVPEMYARLCDI